MSKESWNREFYPVPACDVSEQKAVAHAKTKWVGMLPHNLEKHKCRLSFNRRWILDENGVVSAIAASSCALCCQYATRVKLSCCAGCPLYDIMGVVCGTGGDDPWSQFVSPDDTENGTCLPMVAALTEAEMWYNKRLALAGGSTIADRTAAGYLWAAVEDYRRANNTTEPIRLSRTDDDSLTTAFEDCKRFVAEARCDDDPIVFGHDFWWFRNYPSACSDHFIGLYSHDTTQLLLSVASKFPLLVPDLVGDTFTLRKR